MKSDRRYGFFPWWPEDGNDWLHPEDVDRARKLIPSPRVFRREERDGEFALLRYGDVRLRVRPTLWQEVTHEGFDVGDWVEVLSRGMRNSPAIGVIREMLCHQPSQGLRYQIAEAGQPIPTEFSAEDLRPIDPTEPLTDSD